MVPEFTRPPAATRVLLRRVPPARFDGNQSDELTNWVYPTDEFVEMTDHSLSYLMEMTAQGNLAWVVFPPAGYRL